MYQFYFSLPLLCLYYTARSYLGPATTQRYISISNTYLTILAYLPFCYLPRYQSKIYYWLFEYSASYFLTDCFIILFHNRSQWIFLLHHAASLWLFFQDHLVPNLPLKMLTYFYIEVSNAFLTLYELQRTKRMKQLLTTFYVPYRLLYVPYYSYKLLQLTTHIPYIWVPISSLACMSIGYAIKLHCSLPLNYIPLLPIYLTIECIYHFLPSLIHTQSPLHS